MTRDEYEETREAADFAANHPLYGDMPLLERLIAWWGFSPEQAEQVADFLKRAAQRGYLTQATRALYLCFGRTRKTWR